MDSEEVTTREAVPGAGGPGGAERSDSGAPPPGQWAHQQRGTGCSVEGARVGFGCCAVKVSVSHPDNVEHDTRWSSHRRGAAGYAIWGL